MIENQFAWLLLLPTQRLSVIILFQNMMVYNGLYILSRPSEFYRQARQLSGVGLQAGSHSQAHFLLYLDMKIWCFGWKEKIQQAFFEKSFCVCVFLTIFLLHFWVSFSFHFIGVEFGLAEVCRLPNPHYVVVRLGYLENLTKGDIPQQRTTTPYNCDTRHSL